MRPVAGHTMTLAADDKLVIIGGFSTNEYFSDIVYVCDTNSYPTAWERHTSDIITGAKPTGMHVDFFFLFKGDLFWPVDGPNSFLWSRSLKYHIKNEQRWAKNEKGL